MTVTLFLTWNLSQAER